jgi:hypothetical protein
MDTVKTSPMLTINSQDAGAPAICCVSPSGQPQAEQTPDNFKLASNLYLQNK